MSRELAGGPSPEPRFPGLPVPSALALFSQLGSPPGARLWKPGPGELVPRRSNAGGCPRGAATPSPVPRAIQERAAPGIAHARPVAAPPHTGHRLCVPSRPPEGALGGPTPLGAETPLPHSPDLISDLPPFQRGGGCWGRGGGGVLCGSRQHHPQATRTWSHSSKALLSWPVPRQPHFSHSFPSVRRSLPSLRSLHWHLVPPLLVRGRPGRAVQARRAGGSSSLPSYESYVWNSRGARAFLSGCRCFLYNWKTP